jgi:hypothetical protein
MGPKLIRITRAAFEAPDNKEYFKQALQAVRELVQKISYAISVAKPDGSDIEEKHLETSNAAPIAIPAQADENPGRKKT